MSSPKAATKTRRPATNSKPKAAAKFAPAKPPSLPSPAKRVEDARERAGAGGGLGRGPQNELSDQAIRLAREIERQFAKNDDALSVEAMQALMSALCRVYSAQVENGAKFTPIPEGQVVSPTGVMLTASGLLRAANLAVFELGMWQSWTGR
jgi:hypothetical protein